MHTQFSKACRGDKHNSVINAPEIELDFESKTFQKKKAYKQNLRFTTNRPRGKTFGREIIAGLARKYLIVGFIIRDGSTDVIDEAVDEAIAISQGLACVRSG